MATTNLPSRPAESEAIPSADPSSATSLLTERLQAWKHMCAYLEDYVSETAKMEKSKAKDQEKILKTLNNPLKEGHHFDQSLGGVAGLFENLRANTNAQSNLHLETNKNLTNSVLPILEKLHDEIKGKTKELDKGAGKGSKAVDSARNVSQKHIELLGQHTGGFESAGAKTSATNDPYILQKGVYHRLHKQLQEENNNRSEIISVQNSFQQFEAHVIMTVQTALNTFQQYMGGQADRQKAMYGDIASTAQNIPQDFEWNGFVKRSGGVLIDPHTPARTMEGIQFPNQNHRSTKALVEGSLDRKSRLKGYNSSYYAVTPAGYLHEFKDNDDYAKDPVPETSLYLPDCTVSQLDGQKFTIKGKDNSGNKLAQKLSSAHEYTFKAHTVSDAQLWQSVIAQQASGSNSMPTSPVESRNITPVATNLSQQQEGVTSAPQSAVAHNAGPESAGAAYGHSDPAQEVGYGNMAPQQGLHEKPAVHSGGLTDGGAGYGNVPQGHTTQPAGHLGGGVAGEPAGQGSHFQTRQ